MSDLNQQKCIPCEGGVPALDKAEAEKLLAEVTDWDMNEAATEIRRHFHFKGFYKAMGFTNAVAWLANQEGHHPDMEVGFGYCVVKFTTHAANGLTQNDFICAAKVDALFQP